jgi:hypothetical protein
MIDLTFSGIRTVYLLLIPETKDRSMEYVKTKTTKKRMGAKKTQSYEVFLLIFNCFAGVP